MPYSNKLPCIFTLLFLQQVFSELWGTSDMWITNLCPLLRVMRASCPTGRLSLTVLSVALSSSNTWMSCKGEGFKRKRQRDSVILVLVAEATRLRAYRTCVHFLRSCQRILISQGNLWGLVEISWEDTWSGGKGRRDVKWIAFKNGVRVHGFEKHPRADNFPQRPPSTIPQTYSQIREGLWKQLPSTGWVDMRLRSKRLQRFTGSCSLSQWPAYTPGNGERIES